VATVVCIPAAAAGPVRAHESARAQDDIATGVATSIAAEIAKAGIKAAVAQWAPDLTKYVDPTAHGLAQIQEQLAALDRKVSELVSHQDAMEQHLNCVIQRSSVASILSFARTWFERLKNAANLPDLSARATVMERLYGQYDTMTAYQDHLHYALVNDGLITACAKHIESGMRPYLSARLAYEVRAFYSVYQGAASMLLVLRADMMALHPEQFAADEASSAAKTVEGWWAGEQRYIKPFFPGDMSYDTRSGWLWRYMTVGWSDAALRQTLQSQGWHVTGHATTPTCSAVEAFIKASGRTGSDALNYLRQMNVLHIPNPEKILCYDDHDRIHDFSLVNYSYAYAGDVQSHEPSVAAKPNNGTVNVSTYSYLLG
jgi:hypothetical protein